MGKIKAKIIKIDHPLGVMKFELNEILSKILPELNKKVFSYVAKASSSPEKITIGEALVLRKFLDYIKKSLKQKTN